MLHSEATLNAAVVEPMVLTATSDPVSGSEQPLPPAAERCSGPGPDGSDQCLNWIVYKTARLCRGHYSQKQRHDELVPLTNMRNKGMPCVGPGFDGAACGLPIHSRNSGLCKSHNNQSLQDRELRPLQRRQVLPDLGMCSGPGTSSNTCDRPAAYKKTGLCKTHQKQRNAGGELRPLNPYRHADDPRGECEYDGCNLALYCRGLCAAHYTQRIVGRELGALASASRSPIPCTARNDKGEKHCPGCRQWQPLEAYSVNNNRDDNLSEFCRTCRTANRARTTYGLTAEAYEGLLLDHGGGCFLCSRQNSRGTQKSLSIDHNHACCPGPRSCGECVRGLLCDDCNLAIGFLRDDVELVKRLVLYLLLDGRIPPISPSSARI